jgi:hypothetical protein
MLGWGILALIAFIIVAIFPAWLAGRKGYSFWLFFLISIPFWWITLFVVLFLKDKNSQPPLVTA